jgi:hypothetical protein
MNIFFYARDMRDEDTESVIYDELMLNMTDSADECAK